ncbi:MAG: DUF1801 domain-containing protein [Saprospiraceae bacterium]|nr:DUF1801 domain-containing protein [Saprospiraceae bacterium]
MSKLVVIKTKENNNSVEEFINSIGEEQKRQDCLALLSLFKKFSKEEAKMWGTSMIGFGIKRYKSPASGREVDWFKIGFSPRKANLSLHLVINMQEQAATLGKLGKHKAGVGCLYVNKLSDIDIKVLEELIKISLKSK